jgi:dTMP kinase
MLITFEGLDCSGKTTQARLLVERLEKALQSDREARPSMPKAASSVIFLREPGGTDLSERIRAILLDRQNTRMSAIAEIFLFAAARAQLVSEVIQPALKRGNIVVCDRFYDSTTAYQGWGRGIDREGVQKINAVATSGVAPDLTFFLDIDADEVERRKKLAGIHEDRMESSGKAFYDRVRQGYLEIARAESHRFTVLDGTESIDSLKERIWRVVLDRLKIQKKLTLGGLIS